MRVMFKMGVIGWDLVGEPAGAARARRTPSAAELRGKQGSEHACHGIFLAYDYDRKRSQKSGVQAWQARSKFTASRPTTPRSFPKTRCTTTPLRNGLASAAASSLAHTGWPM